MNLLKIAISAALVTGITAGVVSAQNKGITRAGVASARTTAAAPAYKAQTARGQAAGEIIRTWAGYVHRVYGTTPAAWAKAMQATFAQADARNMQRAARMTTFEGMMSALMGQRASDDKIIDKLARSNGSLAVIQGLGSPSEDLAYTAVTPCRVIDTRLAVGALAAGETRNFVSAGTGFTAQGGAASDCGIPESASAVVMNVTTAAPAFDGFLTVFPYGSERPLASGLNFIVGRDTSNELIVKQTMGQEFDFSVFALSQAHVIVDVAGYFMAPQATSLDCETAFGLFADDVPSGLSTSLTATCPAGFVVTGGGANFTGTGVPNVNSSMPGSPTSWSVQVRRAGGGIVNVQAVAQCCRAPGR